MCFFGLAFVLRNGSLASQVNPTPSDSLFSPLIFPVPVFQLFTVPTISLPELGFFGNQLKMVPPIFFITLEQELTSHTFSWSHL